MTTMTSRSATTHEVPTRGPAPDFPLYAGDPVRLSGRRWAVLMASVVVAAACDLLVAVPGPAWLALALRGTLFAGIPLLTLHLVAPGTVGRLFQRLRPRAGLLAVGIAVANVLASVLVGALVSVLVGTRPNPLGGTIAAQGGLDKVLTFLAMIPQLVGEEVFTVLPLLAVLTLGMSVLRLSRRSSLVLAVVVSALLFAALHLPTYGWNVLQCVLVIGTARVILLIPYLVTKNLTASATAHVLNDWALFGSAAILG
ncbi:CPBP family intramembrane glutamic endopeptidase [Isoptericola sp. NPDC019693]|uniref:CPBP family intramembrane glutamic endopeptidase n=1 Tax=Isoptericola sp. NPDC019693 TaxID=3364009 RepID=UPI003796F0C9